MNSPFRGEAVQPLQIAGSRRETLPDTSAVQNPRYERLALTAAGVIAFAGLGLIALQFTAPFVDPLPSAAIAEPISQNDAIDAEKAQADAIAATQAAIAETSAIGAPPAGPGADSDTASSAGTSNEGSGVEVLAGDDPRWARKDSTALTRAMPILTGKVDAPAAAGPDDLMAFTGNGEDTAEPDETDPPDTFSTAAIPQDATAPAVKSEPAAAKPGADTFWNKALPAARAKVTADVRLRARGKSGSAIVLVVPDGSTVGLVGCNGWCEVVYNGRRGFVYKDYINRNAPDTKVAEQKTPKKPDIVPVTNKSRVGR